MRRQKGTEGFSMIETMIAAAIAGVAFVGTMGAVEVASRSIKHASVIDEAQAMAQSRLEGKRSIQWRKLLLEDMDHDGMSETGMKDDGQGCDAVAGDGVYTAAAEEDGVAEVWTVEVDRLGPIASVGVVTIRSVVTYMGSYGPREVRMETIRANPAFVGRSHS